MSFNLLAPETIELRSRKTTFAGQPNSPTDTAYISVDRNSRNASPIEDEDENNQTRPPSVLSSSGSPLLHPGTEPPKIAVEDSSLAIILHCLPHAVPLAATIAILSLNALEVYWQDLGRPKQNDVLQALQYAAKAYELLVVASLTVIVVHQIQYDLSGARGTPLGLLTAGFQLSEPSFLLTTRFLGGIAVRVRFLLLCLLIVGFILTSVIGPSSAVALIPRLDWWDVSTEDAFGPQYKDRLYFNRTEAELWPSDITNDIYADLGKCDGSITNYQDCAVGAADVVGPWVSLHQSQGSKPNITVFQDGEVVRYLTSEGGPPENSSWTVASTVGSVFAKDLDHYWDWVFENSSLPTNINQPLLRPSFKNSNFRIRKPLVQSQCQSFYNPDWEHDPFHFPHNELLTPPLDKFIKESWTLPNTFVLGLKGNNSLGNTDDTSNPWIVFDWFDTASNFSSTGAPSLGAVIMYLSDNGTSLVPTLTTCSFDGRWVPVRYYLDPKDTITILQDSPSPMKIVKSIEKEGAKDLIQMRLSLQWANTLDVRGASSNDPMASVVEEMLERFSGGNFIYPEPSRAPAKVAGGYVVETIDWRLSTTLGLYLTEALARAFSDDRKGSMLYRQAPELAESYVRYLDDINQPALKEGYKDGRLDWVETRDPRWNSSRYKTWDQWAPDNGYTELTF